MKALLDGGLEAIVTARGPGLPVLGALVAAVGALAAAAKRQLVVMNDVELPPSSVPCPQSPNDDFSVALWTYAEEALKKSGMGVARISYWGGEPVNGQEDRAPEDRDIAYIQFYEDADEYETTRRASGVWPRPRKWYYVDASGRIKRSVDRSPTWDPSTEKWVYKKPPFDVVGNICTWKFKKEALSAPPARKERLTSRQAQFRAATQRVPTIRTTVTVRDRKD